MDEIPFVNMPVSVFDRLKRRVEETSGDDVVAKDALRSLGYGWAADSVKELGLKADAEGLSYQLRQFSIQMGIVKVDVLNAGGKAVEVTVREAEVDDEDFLLGFIAGAVSGILGMDYRGEVAATDPLTIFLTPSIFDIGAAGSAKGDWGPLARGEAYVIEDGNSAERAFGIVSGLLDSGVQVFCVSRVFPPKARKRNGKLDLARLAWLSDTDIKSGAEDFEVFSPRRPDFELSRGIISFIKASSPCVVMLHGTEYLISQTSFNTVEKFLQTMKDVAVTHDSTLLLPVNPKALGDERYSKLQTEFVLLE